MSGDVLVIGAGPAGLAAAAYLARAGAHVVVLEAEDEPGGSCADSMKVGDLALPAGAHSFTALDPRVIKELRLTKLGLKFAARDLPLAALRADARPLVLGRDMHEARHAIAPLSARDAERYPDFQRRLFDFARALRAIWWEEGSLKREEHSDELHRLSLTSASALVEAAFESEALRAAFGFDALAAGLSPSDAGSSLTLCWRAAQEMCGLQGAVAVPAGGPAGLVRVLTKAAQRAGAEIRTGARVTQLLLEGDAVSGVAAANGDVILAGTVLSSLSRRTTLLDFLPPGAAGFATAHRLEHPHDVGEGKLILSLNAFPFTFKQSARYVIAERLEGCIAAHAEARAGRMPAEPALEAMMVETGGTFMLSVLIRPLPVSPAAEPRAFQTRLLQTVLRTLERHVPELTADVTGFDYRPPVACDPFTVPRMLSSWRERITTPVLGLFLCGEAAEPLPAVSCRASRIAASMAIEEMKRSRR